MTSNTYFIFNNKYYKKIINTKIELKIDDKEGLFFEINNENDNEIKKNINSFLLLKKFIKQYYNDNNKIYIIYEKTESLLTIRQLVNTDNNKNEILYIIDIDDNELTKELTEELTKELTEELTEELRTELTKEFYIEL